MENKPDLIIYNIGQLLTIRGTTQKPKVLRQMDDLGIIEDGAVAVKDGKFIHVSNTIEIRKRYEFGAIKTFDASGKAAMPGFVDCHTHSLFGGNRAAEFVERIQGATYLEILRKGGGILSTVNNTRKLSTEELTEITQKHLDSMLLHGTTTVEIKSGYGLDLMNEIKILKSIRELQKTHCLDIVPTFLGAHAIPVEYKHDPDAYVDLVCDMLPFAKEYAVFCDVFCDEGAFNAKQTEKIFHTARNLGFQLKLHSNEFKDIGGIPLAIKYEAVSIEHLDHVTPKEISQLSGSKAICVLLPGIPLFLMKDTYAPAKEMLEKGLAIALATDFNPGTCPCLNMQIMITLGSLKMSMTPAQAINAATINAAHALSMAHRVGSIEEGKQADMIILDINDYRQLSYYFGVNHVQTVIKNGRLVVDNKVLVK
ncbi:MAG: imidazolonepropionase [Candidatus Kuenenia sp.]|nr:imidazolonepropionase [Candidatus Kuenenia hertensis]